MNKQSNTLRENNSNYFELLTFFLPIKQRNEKSNFGEDRFSIAKF
jgi:hypothetical protein